MLTITGLTRPMLRSALGVSRRFISLRNANAATAGSHSGADVLFHLGLAQTMTSLASSRM